MATPKVFSGEVGTPIRWPDGSGSSGSGQLTADQIAALAGTVGSPSNSNRFVTNADSRLSDPRNPAAHAITHKAGGVDVLLLDELGSPLDRTLLNATVARHGLLPKLSGLTSDYFAGDGVFRPLPAAPIPPIPSGTGFRHITAGVEDALAKLVEDADVSALAGIVESKLALNFPTHDNANDPTADEKAALAGTDGTPSALNPYVTDSDPRNTNDRFPTAHASTHMAAGLDPIRIDELKVGTNVTTLNSTVTEHGLLPRLSGVATEFLNGLGSWAVPSGVALSGSAYVIIGGSANSVTNGTDLIAAYTAAELSTPHGAALSATNRFTICLLPGIYTVTAGALVLDTQFIDIYGLGGTPLDIIVTSNGKTLSVTAQDVLLANFQITTTAAGTATLATNDYAFYPADNLASLKCLGMVFSSGLSSNNRAMRGGIIYSGLFYGCFCASDRGFGCSVGAVAGAASGKFLECQCYGRGFGNGAGSFSAVKGVASGSFYRCRAGGGGFGGDGDATGFFFYCTTWETFTTPYFAWNISSGGSQSSFGGGDSNTALTASGAFFSCRTGGSPSFGYNINSPGGTASGRFEDCHSTQVRSFGSTLCSGVFINCTSLGNSFGGAEAGTPSLTGQFFNCVAYGNVTFGGRAGAAAGSISAAAVLVNCFALDTAFCGSTNNNGGTIAGLLINCRAGSTSFCSTAGTPGTISGTLSGCRASGTFNPVITGSVILCDFPSLNTQQAGVVTPAAFQYAGVFGVTTNNSAGNAQSNIGLYGKAVQGTAQNLTASPLIVSGSIDAGLTGLRGYALATGAATVTAAVGVAAQVAIRSGTTVTSAVGFLSSPLFNDVGAVTVGNAYGVYVRAAGVTGLTLSGAFYGLYVESTASVYSKFGVYTADAAAYNVFMGPTGVGAQAAVTTWLHVQKNYTATAITNTMTQFLQEAAQADNTGTDYIAQKIQVLTTTGSNFSTSASGYGLVGILGQVVHGQAGTASMMTGGWFRVAKNGTGVVASADALRLHIQNNNANAITTSRALYIMAPLLGGGGTIGTSYAIYQEGTTDLNSLLGKSGFGVAASASSWATFAASTTAIASYRITTGVKPTATVDGDTWYDSTQKCDRFRRDGLDQYQIAMVFSQNTDVTIANTVVETTVFGAGIGTLSLPAAFWALCKKLRITLYGTIATTGTPTGRLRVFLGAQVVADTTAAALSGTITGTEALKIDVILNCHVNGGAGVGVIGACGTLMHHQGVVVGAYGGLEMNHTDTTMDTTDARAIDVKWTWGTANPANSLHVEYGTVEVIG